MEALFSLIQCQVYFRATLIGMLILPMLAISTSIADGSKDLINNGGYRPFLEAGNGRTMAGIDRLNHFYIYARSGETLQLGSSALGIYEGDILFTRPDGTSGSCLALKPENASSNWGVIRSIEEEKAGPLPHAGGYTACEVLVDVSNEGIWEVVFLGPAPDSWKFSSPLPANTPWIQATDVYTVAAWDITVKDEDESTVSGRVYVHHLPLNMGGAQEALFSGLYVLTKDGYQYRIDMNGAAGHTLLVFANASGFQQSNANQPVYASVALDELNTANNGLPDLISLHSPLTPDTDNTSTHKLFFSLPNEDLPIAAMHGAEPTWLLNAVVLPATLQGLTYSGSVGKTGSFSFQAVAAGRYLLTIDLNQNGIWGDEKDTFLAGFAQAGENILPWSGMDAEGYAVVGTEKGYQARVVSVAGEMHLPVLDLENQALGFTVERLNGPESPDFTVHYNDAAFAERAGRPDPANGRGGTDSRAGAHAFVQSFGDAVGIDTWAYAASEPAYIDEPLFALYNDLRLSIAIDTQTPAKNQPFTSTIRVANDGPDDAAGIRVELLMPTEFQVQGVEGEDGFYTQDTHTWHIDELPNGTEAELELTLQTSLKGAFTVFAEIIEHQGQDPDSTPNNFDERVPDEQQEDDTDEAYVYVNAEASLGIAEHITAFTGDLTGFSATFELLIENLGNTPLTSVQVTEDLTARFQGTDFQVVNIDAVSPLKINPSFDGDFDTNLLDTTQSQLGVGEQATLSYTIAATPFGNLGPYAGNAYGFAEGFDGVRVEDISDDGLVTDLNKDGVANGTDENDPTILTIAYEPAVGLAMEITNVTGNSSTFSADYNLVVENLGTAPLSNVQVINDLGGLLGPGDITVTNLSVSAPLNVNDGFDGQGVDDMLNAATSHLDVGEKATLSFHLQAAPSFGLGYFNQVARVTANVPDGTSVFDMSDDGQEPDANGNGRADDSGEDDVTVIAFDEQPALGVSLFTTRVTGDLGGFGIDYELKIRNLGDVVLSGVQILEDLESAFEGTSFTVSDLAATQPLLINPDYDGVVDKNLLTRTGNTLGTQASATITFTVDVFPETNYGPFSNSAIAYADSPQGITTTDTSDNGSDVDPDNDGNANETGENDPTITAFAPTGHLGTALGVINITGDLNAFKVIYTVVAENLGDVPLSALSLVQDLEASLAGTRYEVLRVTAEPPFEANPLFDGFNYQELLAQSPEELGVGNQTSVEIELNVVPIDHFGPFEMSSTAVAFTPFGTTLSDESTDGINPDPNHNGNPTEAGENTPSVLSLDERPVIGLSMAVTSLQGDLKGFTARYIVRVENLGDVPLQNVNVTSDFATVFQGAEIEIIQKNVRGSLVLNQDFDGVQNIDLLDVSTSTLAPNDTARIELDVRVLPISNFGPYTHSVVASASGPHGTGTVDVSDDGFEPDVNGNGIPNEDNENRPTLVSLASQPAVGAAKILTNIQELVDGFEASFSVTLRNTGDVTLNSIQIIEDLASAFPASEIEVLHVESSGTSDFPPNTNFDGRTEINLLQDNVPEFAPGQDFVMSYTIAVMPGNGAVDYETQALAKALDPSGNELTDLSNDGTDPDPNGNGISSETGEDTPTRVDPVFKPSFHLNTHVDRVEGDTSRFEVQLSVVLENNGAVALDSLNMAVDLDDLFPEAGITVVDLWTVSGYDAPVNLDYDGRSSTTLLVPAGATLLPGQSGRVKMLVEVIPGVNVGPYKGEIEASGVTMKGQAVYNSANLSPIRVATSTGEEAGLESNGDLSTLVSARNYRQQNDRAQRAGWLTSAAKYEAAPLLRIAGVSGVDGTGSLTNLEVLELVPTEGPKGSSGVVTTPDDLFGITNATSVLAVDYVAQDARVAALFATTSPVDELYDHTKNICDRLKGGSLESVELISIQGHPFVLSVLAHDNGEIDYAISFIGYRYGLSYLVDSRFIRESYQTRIGIAGEILNFQVWSFNPAYTIAIVEEILTRMEAAGGVGYVSREDNIPQIPNVFVQRGSYQAGQLVFRLRNQPGLSEFRFQGETSSVEGGEKSVFERVVPVSGTAGDEDEVVVVLPSGLLFDALLTVTNDANDNIDQVYIADGPWGKVEDEEEGTNIESFEVLEQINYDPNNSQMVVERGIELKGTVAKNIILFRHFKPGGRSVDLSDFSYVSFRASGIGKVQLRLEEVNVNGDFFTKDVELKAMPTTHTIFFNEFAKRDGQLGFKGISTSAISFSFESNESDPIAVELRVEDIVFGKGEPTQSEDASLIPTVYSLSQNYPNPFNPSTTIQFGLPEPAKVALEVFDMLGRQVMTITKQDYIAGRHKLTLDASRLASGAYIYRLVANDEVFTKVMTVVK